TDPPLCVYTDPLVADYHVAEAFKFNDPVSNNIVVDIILTDEGREIFSGYTRENPERRLALVVDGKILSVIVIRSPIENGRIRIQGLWLEDAVVLLNQINQK
ncbi:MAG: hypothetical protein R3318_07410, partial [Gammaproteobacteria bacterium]|nr:hypothetical protein [Gammaproteobacteria bacterium]